MLVDIRLNDRVCLNIYGVSPTVGLDSKGQIRVRVDIPVEPTEEPEASVLIAKSGISCWFSIVVSFSDYSKLCQ